MIKGSMKECGKKDIDENCLKCLEPLGTREELEISCKDYDRIMKQKLKNRLACKKCFSLNVITGSDGTYCRSCGHLKVWTIKQYEKVWGKDKQMR